MALFTKVELLSKNRRKSSGLCATIYRLLLSSGIRTWAVEHRTESFQEAVDKALEFLEKYKDDYVWVDAEDMDYHLPMVGQNVIVQFNHDDVEIVYVQNLQTVQGTYTVVNANEKGIENFDNEKYVFVVNDFDENDTMVLENDGSYKTGDKVNIAMKISSSIDDIVDIQKVSKDEQLIK